MFEEIPSDSNSDTETVWVPRTKIVDPQDSVIDVKFGPKREGLILALASVDGIVLIHQATSPFNLTVWKQHSKIKALKLCTLSSISWSSVNTLPTLLAIGANGSRLAEKTERFGLFELVFNPGAASVNDDKRDFDWFRVSDVQIEINDPEVVHEVAFAPSFGRRYHLLAIATSEVRVLRIELPFDKPNYSLSQQQKGNDFVSKYIFSSDSVVSNCQGASFRVSWNCFGTMLAVSSGNGNVKLYKQNYFQKWCCVTSVGSKESISKPLKTDNASASNSANKQTGRNSQRSAAKNTLFSPDNRKIH